MLLHLQLDSKLSPFSAFSVMFLGLLFFGQPLAAAQEQDVQAELKELRELLSQQQKELAAQRILIEQLQGSQQTTKNDTHTPAVVKPTVDSTAVAQQPGTDTPPAAADQSGQQQAVKALAQQQEVAPETGPEEYEALKFLRRSVRKRMRSGTIPS